MMMPVLTMTVGRLIFFICLNITRGSRLSSICFQSLGIVIHKILIRHISNDALSGFPIPASSHQVVDDSFKNFVIAHKGIMSMFLFLSTTNYRVAMNSFP